MNRCQLDHLYGLATNKQRRQALGQLPPTLPKTYERILLRANDQAAPSTIKFMERTLRFIATAKRRLSIREMAHAISVEVEDRSLDETLEMDTVLAMCSSLVRNVYGSLQFSHFSVEEFLQEIGPNNGELSRFHITQSDNDILTNTCLTYILLEDFDKQGSLRPADMNLDPYSGETSYPFYDYAAIWWMYHMPVFDADDDVPDLVLELFDLKKTDQFVLWVHFWLSSNHMYSDGLEEQLYGITPLHIACIFGFAGLADRLIKQGANVNGSSTALMTPLKCAISGWYHPCLGDRDWDLCGKDRHQTVSRILLEDIVIDQSVYDPVEDALNHGDVATASLLLEKGFQLT